MHPLVHALIGRLSLRPPQRRSLEILDRIMEISPKGAEVELSSILKAIRIEFPTVEDFERDFPSFCFALATGVGKTRLMGAFISYLHLGHGINNFFVLAPNLTIYNKLITDFTPNTTKYVFKGIAEFATLPPELITGDTYETKALSLFSQQHVCKINIFNISKINSEVRGGRSPRIKRLSEYIGESYFDYLAGLPDLALIMDESHRYRASAGIRAINDLKPLVGLELTATPQVEARGNVVRFKNIIYDYPLGQAIADGFVKQPAVVTRKNFTPSGMLPEEIERLKLEDGIRLHESVKVELETYARESGNSLVKPILLIIARDISHSTQLIATIQSDFFFAGYYADKVIQVDSSRTGNEEDAMIQRLLAIEQPDEATEIVVHVNMLKEGWDVTNLYTIVPLRAANAKTLIEQSIGRGLRLPYGVRTGISAIDRLNIIAHDKFQEIVDEANKPTSSVRLQIIEMEGDSLPLKTSLVLSRPKLIHSLGMQSEATVSSEAINAERLFQGPQEERIAKLAFETIQNLQNFPGKLAAASLLHNQAIQTEIAAIVQAKYYPAQLELQGTAPQPDIAAIVKATAKFVASQTIDIPRILILPSSEVKSGFKEFQLNLAGLHYPAVSEELWIQHLATNKQEILNVRRDGVEEKRLEDYVVSGLVDFDDISYDDHADLLYLLATETVAHFKKYLPEEDIARVLQCHQREIARFVHAQMQENYWETAASYEIKISKGFTDLKDSAYSVFVGQSPLDFHQAPPDKNNMAKYLFGGFERCLYSVQKFHSDPERKMALILDRETNKWFRPAKGQFQIYYKSGGDHLEYQPDFTAETDDAIYMLEVKRTSEIDAPDVQAKRSAGIEWCRHATTYALSYNGKPWRYLLIPHHVIAENMTLKSLANQFGSTSATHGMKED